jgi:hypothetical protein
VCQLVGAVLRAVVGAGVGGVAVGTVGLLLLVVDRHEVLHVHCLLPFLVSADAHRCQAKTSKEFLTLKHVCEDKE